MDYYTFEDGVLKRVNHLELKILLKYASVLLLGLVVGYVVFWLVGHVRIP